MLIVISLAIASQSLGADMPPLAPLVLPEIAATNEAPVGSGDVVALIEARCPPLEAKEAGPRFPFGLPRSATLESLGVCLTACRVIAGGATQCDLAVQKSEPAELVADGVRMPLVELRFAGAEPAAALYEVIVSGGVGDDCGAAVGGLAALHSIVRARYPRASVSVGARHGSRRCAHHRQEGNVGIRSSSGAWTITADSYFDDGFVIYLRVTNTVSARPVKKALREREAAALRGNVSKL